jgi:hypothetical protein
MKLSSILLAALGATSTLAHPGMGRAVAEVEDLARRQKGGLSDELIGDLATLPANKLSKEGRAVRDIITGRVAAESDDRALIRLPLRGGLCKLDTCCVWQHVAEDMEALFRGESGRCTALARQAIRLGFHDAGTWSKSGGGGGADGSILLAGEMARFENAGMAPVAAKYTELHAKYHDQLGYSAVGMADLIQFGATVATVTCPLGPRIRSFVGRRDSTTPNPTGKLPSPFADAASLISMFADKTFTARGLVALLGAHTTSQQTAINATRSGDPQDSTPGVWDNLFFQQTLGTVPAPPRVFTFVSDANLARHPETRPVFEEFARGGPAQRGWNRDYAREYVRLSLLGVGNVNGLKECTRALPRSTARYAPRDQGLLDKWLKSIDWSPISKTISRLLEDGKEIDVQEKDIPTKAPKAGSAPF